MSEKQQILNTIKLIDDTIAASKEVIDMQRFLGFDHLTQKSAMAFYTLLTEGIKMMETRANLVTYARMQYGMDIQ